MLVKNSSHVFDETKYRRYLQAHSLFCSLYPLICLRNHEDPVVFSEVAPTDHNSFLALSTIF